MANVMIINKVDTAEPENVKKVKENIKNANPNALILEAASPLTAENPELIKGKRALVIEDGPTLTHGNMPYGAATIMAQKSGASEIVDPRPYAVGSIKETYKKYTHLGKILPALGYGEKQIAELKETINRTPCDVVVIGTPIDLRRVMTINKPTVRVKYELQVLGPVTLEQILEEFLKKGGKW
jgi:predicted GTPase